MADNKIPKQVFDAIGDISKDDVFIGVENVGVYENKDVYKIKMSEDSETGYPLIYLYDGKKVEQVYGFDALNLELSLQK